MKTSDHNSNELDDGKVDAILNRFFAFEVPEEFRTAPAPEAVDHPPAAAPPRPRRLRLYASAAIVVTGLLAAFGGWWFRTPAPPVANEVFDFSLGKSTPQSNGEAETFSSGPAPQPKTMHITRPLMFPPGDEVDYSLSEDVEPVESLRYKTLRGMVEQRTRLNTKKVFLVEPNRGESLELKVPELVIEVEPVEEGERTVPVGGFDNPPSAQPNGENPPVGLPRKR